MHVSRAKLTVVFATGYTYVSSVAELGGLHPLTRYYFSYAVVGGVVIGASWYLYRLARGPTGVLHLLALTLGY